MFLKLNFLGRSIFWLPEKSSVPSMNIHVTTQCLRRHKLSAAVAATIRPWWPKVSSKLTRHIICKCPLFPCLTTNLRPPRQDFHVYNNIIIPNGHLQKEGQIEDPLHLRREPVKG